jgi:hypothetical protein
MSGFADVLKALAPTVATILGGPLAGMAVEAIGSAMGISEPTQDKIKSIFESGQMTAEQVSQIKQAEIALKLKLKELDIKVEEIHAGDRDSARRMQSEVKSIMPPVLAGLIVALYICVQWFLLTGVINDDMREIVMRSLGTLDASLGLVLSFYFGSSKSSEDKTALLAKR